MDKHFRFYTRELEIKMKRSAFEVEVGNLEIEMPLLTKTPSIALGIWVD